MHPAAVPPFTPVYGPTGVPVPTMQLRQKTDPAYPRSMSIAPARVHFDGSYKIHAISFCVILFGQGQRGKNLKVTF